MTRHVLILGNNLTGLVTAYRLIHYGFRVSILDTESEVSEKKSLPTIQESRGRKNPAHTSLHSNTQTYPLILHGLYYDTWSLLQELSFEWPTPTVQSVCIEFGNDTGPPIALPKSSRITKIHPITRFTFFKGLSWSDRWNIINFLEKQWEENRLTDHHPDIQNAESWLIAAKQSDHSRSQFWNPLCRFFLLCDLPEASLSSFINIFSHYWFDRQSNTETYLAPMGTLEKLDIQLRQWLLNKGTQFHSTSGTLHLHTDTTGIQSVQLRGHHVVAQAYVSALTPQNLLSLLPERALARYAYFSSLTQIPEAYGLAIQFNVKGTLLPPRLILHVDSFDWITSQPSSRPNEPETMITCITLREATIHKNTEKELIHDAWVCIQYLFKLPPTQILESCEPHIFQQTSPFYPSHQGSRTHRPLTQTPLHNFFLAGPWIATELPTSLESSIKSANACAQAVSSAFYGSQD